MIKAIIRRLCNRETLAYLICGSLSVIIGIVVFWMCEYAGFHLAVSNTVSTATAVFFAYFANKIFVFRSGYWTINTVAREFFSFITGRFATYIIETLLLILLVGIIGLPGIVCKAFTTILVVIGNYLISKKIVFATDVSGQKR